MELKATKSFFDAQTLELIFNLVTSATSRKRPERSYAPSMPVSALRQADSSSAAYLGIDLGTHALKAVGLVGAACGGRPQATHSVSVIYDEHLPQYAPAVTHDTGSGVADVDPRVFLAALDLGLERLKDAGFPLHNVRALTGSAQQHGSVYATRHLKHCLRELNPEYPLDGKENIPASCFSFPRAPIWLDASTQRECEELERRLGGPERVATVTGSRAYERFTACQIAKRKRLDPVRFDQTDRILLISSFMASVMTGALAPEDVGDASGMNLAVLSSDPMVWWPDAVNAVGDESKLCAHPVYGWTIVGNVSTYFSVKYGLPREAHVVVWSGDNPNTIAGYGGLTEDDLLVSLGTSDTAQWTTRDGHGAPFGHTFRSPLSKSPRFFRMLCYSNGSQTREAVRDARFTCEDNSAPHDSNPLHIIKRSWADFDAAVESVPPGCDPARVAICHAVAEIVPRAAADSRVRVFAVGSADTEARATWPELCRLVVESRALAIAAQTVDLELAAGASDKSPRFQRVLLTGGGSASRVFPQILADVLGVPVYALTLSASAAVGAGFRAYHAEKVLHNGHFVSFEESLANVEDAKAGQHQDNLNDFQLLAKPRESIAQMYKKAHLPLFRKLTFVGLKS